MKIYIDIDSSSDLKDWARDNAWSGGLQRVETINELSIDNFNACWEEVYQMLESSEENSETDINDFLWFSCDEIIEAYQKEEENKK